MKESMFILSHVSLGMICIMFAIVIRNSKRTTTSRHFLIYIVLVFIWTFSVIAGEYCMRSGHDDMTMVSEKLTYLGVAFIPVTFMRIGMTLNSANKKIKIRPFVFYIVPVITQIIVWTNPLHHFFYISYSFNDITEVVLGWYFYLHSAYSYICLITGLVLIIRFAFNNRGSSYRQAVLILGGSLIPFIVNIYYTLRVGNLSIFSTPFAFTITMGIYLFGIFRFNLFGVTPTALRTVINRISDLYVVIDDRMIIRDYNDPFKQYFGNHLKVRRKISMFEAIENNKIGITAEDLRKSIDNCREKGVVIYREFTLALDNMTHYYSVEYTPLIVEGVYCGCILLLRDITQAKNDMEEIKRNQEKLIERERLASLGQLIGGIAHNLKTPIMAVSGRAENLLVLIDEYQESIGVESVTAEDHSEIAREMRVEVDRIQGHMSYISDIISTVKDQTVKFNTGIKNYFTIADLINRVKLLMQYELLRNGCEMVIELQASESLILNGDINSLVQIMDNIILNAVQAYNGKKGKIMVKVWKNQVELNISIADQAGGIDKSVQKKLFRQMVTTKGTEGTGLGLYISYSTIVGVFGGKMEFTSLEGQGTEFVITLPLESTERR